jgi:hypothetical protein
MIKRRDDVGGRHNKHAQKEESRVSAVALTQRARTRTRTNQEEHPSAWGRPVVDDTDVNVNADPIPIPIPAPLPGLDSGCSSWASVGMLRGDEGGYIIQKGMDGGGRKRRGEKAVFVSAWFGCNRVIRAGTESNLRQNNCHVTAAFPLLVVFASQ